MEEDYRKEIDRIIGEIKCPKDFLCYKSGFDNLCKARDAGLELFLDCLEEKPEECTFSMLMGSSHMCQCPLRVYICKKLGK